MISFKYKYFLLTTFVISSQGAPRVSIGLLQEALSLGQTSNATRDDCIWRIENDVCSKSSVRFTLYTKRSASSENLCDSETDITCVDEDIKSEEIDIKSPAWLHSSNWNPSHETVVLVHGYGGTSDVLPTGILRDAYLQNGTYNVIVVDWGQLAKIPCYVSAVHNIKSVAKCLAELFIFLRNSGLDMKKSACIGHSLGLDPAKPLIPNASKSKLDTADAEMVQVLHTSSNFGDSKKTGHVDFYFNGGRIQPFCVNVTEEELCSHLKSVCYLAESIFSASIRFGTKCRRRNVLLDDNPKGLLNRFTSAHYVPIGHPTPHGIVGTYCVSNVEPPFCATNKTAIGHPLCCQ